MGRVYSFSEIDNARVPDERDFQRAGETFDSEISALIKQGLVDGGLIFGAAAIKQTTRRSKFDVFVATPNESAESMDAVKEVMGAMYRATHHRVIASPIVRTTSELRSGRHEIDRYFGSHLQGQQRIVVCQDPVADIVYPSQTAQQILGGYLTNKKRRLSEGYCTESPGAIRRETLQRMFELPIAVGRKLVQAVTEVKGEQPFTQAAYKQAVAEQFKYVMNGQPGIMNAFRQLVRHDQDYSKVLLQTIRGKIHQKDYNAELDNYYSRIPEAVRWISQIEDAVLPQLAN